MVSTVAAQIPFAAQRGQAVKVVTSGSSAQSGWLMADWTPPDSMILCSSAALDCGMRSDFRVVRVPAGAIRAVLQPTGTHWQRGAIVGAAVGAAAGALLVAAIGYGNCSDCSGPHRAWLAVPIGAAASAVLGGLVGAGQPRWRHAWPVVRDAPSAAPAASRTAQSAVASVQIPPTYGVEGGIIGALLIGGMASTICDYERSGSLGCHLGIGIMVGGALGFPIGSLLGGLIPKRPRVQP